jgi:hypothetical protein
VRLAIGLSPSALQHASERLRDDKDMVRVAMGADPNAVRHASDGLRDDPELIREAILLGVNGDPSVRQDEALDFGLTGLGVLYSPKAPHRAALEPGSEKERLLEIRGPVRWPRSS